MKIITIPKIVDSESLDTIELLERLKKVNPASLQIRTHIAELMDLIKRRKITYTIE